ncbi:MAG: ABC transporter ATP-binding protein [Actinomycetota bacterium]|nr:ABC transporter ATP-binding protein [Actinomycetota bacterium]
MNAAQGKALLEVRDLVVTYPGPPPVRALDGVSLGVQRSQCLGVLGESGSGKSSLARATLGLLSEATVEGDLRLGDLDLRSLNEDRWRAVRWRRIALSFQSTAALNPVLRIGHQMAEPLRLHLNMDREEAANRAGELLVQIGLGEWAVHRFPRELSGGQRRLVLVAMALSCRPEVAILDEPTAGLDPVTRNRMLDLLQSVREEHGTALVVLSHDADALELVADEVAVLYRGWLAEVGPREKVLDDPRNPYSWALLNARPTLASVKDLRGIRGAPPDPTERAEGCPFYGRCHQGREEVCTPERPPLIPPTGEDGPRLVACTRGGTASLIEARNLQKVYTSRGLLGRRREVRVVNDVSFDVREGEVLGLVGATGAGKSTLGMLVVRLLEADGGSVRFDGRDLFAAGGHELKALRAEMQMLFQDPFEALSPRMTIRQVVREPLDVQDRGDDKWRDETVRRTIRECRLPSDDAFLSRHTHELSGGQLQRVALARALVLQPRLVVADEAVSMLDPSEQAKMILLLKGLQVERGMAMIFISHDLATVLRVSDRVLVLHRGKLVEQGAGGALLAAPKHPATKSLLSAAGRDLLFGTSGNGAAMTASPV